MDTENRGVFQTVSFEGSWLEDIHARYQPEQHPIRHWELQPYSGPVYYALTTIDDLTWSRIMHSLWLFNRGKLGKPRGHIQPDQIRRSYQGGGYAAAMARLNDSLSKLWNGGRFAPVSLWQTEYPEPLDWSLDKKANT